MTVPTYNTYERLIRAAYQNAGHLRGTANPTSDQYDEGLARLKDIINTEQTQGVKLWLQYDLAVPLTTGINSYTIMPGGTVNMTRPVRVIDGGYYLYTTGEVRPLNLIAKFDWDMLSNKTTQGSITSYWGQKLFDRLVVNFWPNVTSEDAASGAAHIQVQQQVINPSAITDTVIFPIEWYQFLTWALTDELATGQPQSIMDRAQAKYLYYKELLENWDVDDAPTTIGADTQTGYPMTGSFT